MLALLFGQPYRSFYTNELLRLAATGRGGLQRELARLVASGLVSATTVGNQKHYRANEAAPIFNELRGIVLKTFGLADVVREALAPLAAKIRLAFIFGSAAEEILGRRISPTLYGAAEFERKVRDDNHFVTRVLAQPKIFLKGTADDLPAGQPA